MLSRATRRGATAMLSFVILACGGGSEPSTPSDPATETYDASLGVDISTMTRLSDQLYFKDLVVGTGTSAVRATTVSVQYKGSLTNGTAFDSSYVRGPLVFQLGQGQVIAGWDEGISGMRAGGRRLLVIGSSLGYGSAGQGSIPANATLVFDVQLLSVR